MAKDPDFYKKIGAKGGSRLTPTSGFASLIVGDDGLTGPERARVAGARGGRISRRYAAEEKESAKIENVVHDNIKITVTVADDRPANVQVRRTNKRSMFANIRRMFL